MSADARKSDHDRKELEKREEPESLKDATRTALLEGRVVITAMTTLFGFQLAVVFTERFEARVAPFEQQLHLVALGLIAVAIGLAMLPAAYGRQAEPRQVSRRFIRLTSRTLTISMLPMLASIALDFRLIAILVLGPGLVPALLTSGLAAYLAILWFVFPRVRAWRLARHGLGPANDPSGGPTSRPELAR
jgi:hypothetical protein